MPLGIDATIALRARTTGRRPLTRLAAAAATRPYNTRTHTGPAADADRQPGPGVDRGRRAPGARALPLLRRQAGRQRRARVLATDAQFQRDAAAYHQARGQAGRQATRALQVARCARLGVLGWPVAHSRSPAMHNAALAALGLDDWRYQRLPVPPELFAETVARAARGAASPART